MSCITGDLYVRKIPKIIIINSFVVFLLIFLDYNLMENDLTIMMTHPALGGVV